MKMLFSPATSKLSQWRDFLFFFLRTPPINFLVPHSFFFLGWNFRAVLVSQREIIKGVLEAREKYCRWKVKDIVFN